MNYSESCDTTHKKLVIDARKAMDAGIGTYIQQIVPRVCLKLKGLECVILVSKASSEWARKVLINKNQNISLLIVNASPLSFKEQILFRKTLTPNTLFWATSLSHPLFYNGSYITTVHDVLQLALPSKFAGGLLTKIASRLFLKSILAKSQELVFLSTSTKSEFVRYVGEPKQKSNIVRLGVDASWFNIDRRAKVQVRKPYFISVSSVRPHKNLSFLLHAFLLILDRIPHDLILVGDKRGLDCLEPALMEMLSLHTDRIRFLGKISDNELRSLVQNSSAMIFPSLYEGFGLPPLEAMAAGIPVICSSIPAVQEVCGSAALYFDPINQKSLIDILIKFNALDESGLHEIIRLGRDKAATYNWDIAAENMVDILSRNLLMNE